MQHAKPQLAMSEPLYRPHGQQSGMASLQSHPPATSGTVAAPHQPAFLSPLLSTPSGQLPAGQLPGAHPPYGAYGTPLAIPPGYMLVPAPGAVQVKLCPQHLPDACSAIAAFFSEQIRAAHVVLQVQGTCIQQQRSS